MDDLLEALARLNARLDDLEQRVTRLEITPDATQAVAALSPAPVNVGPVSETLSLTQTGRLLPIAGKAMLGIAGAYLLRAVAESGSIPKILVVVLALAYAGLWLLWSAHVAPGSRLAGAAYSTTAVLILGPMLWELTLSFKVLSPPVTADILVALVIFATCLAWKHSLVWLVWVVNGTAVLMALVFMIAARDVVPFVSALLCMAMVAELAACLDHWPGLRTPVAIGADLAMAVAIYLSVSPESVRSEYASLGPATIVMLSSVLFVIYGTSTAFQTLFLRRRITIFEIGQVSATFLLAACAAAGGSYANGAFSLGMCMLILSLACYATAFAAPMCASRNYHVYSTWSALLFVAGCLLSLPLLAMVLCLSAAAVLSTFLGFRFARLTLEFHGLVYLTVAALVSGLLVYAGRALAGTFPATPGWIDWAVASAAMLCYAILGRDRGEPRKHVLLQLLSAVLAVSAAATFLVSILVWTATLGITPGQSHVAVIRTLTICILALTLAFSGSRWRRIELVWIAYAMLGLVTAKLLLEDMHHSHPSFIAISIVLYALSLIIIPRLVRMGRQASQASKEESRHSDGHVCTNV